MQSNNFNINDQTKGNNLNNFEYKINAKSNNFEYKNNANSSNFYNFEYKINLNNLNQTSSVTESDSENFDLAKKSIKSDVLFILDTIKQDRYFLNKHFQNSINNYFLEDYAGQFLKDKLSMAKARDITNYVQSKYQKLIKDAKYIQIMTGYVRELEQNGQIEAFCNFLLDQIKGGAQSAEKGSKDWQSNVWKRAFSLFVYQYINNQQQTSIFEIWNSLFPHDQIQRKRQKNLNHRSDEYQHEKLAHAHLLQKSQKNKSEGNLVAHTHLQTTLNQQDLQKSHHYELIPHNESLFEQTFFLYQQSSNNQIQFQNPQTQHNQQLLQQQQQQQHFQQPHQQQSQCFQQTKRASSFYDPLQNTDSHKHNIINSEEGDDEQHNQMDAENDNQCHNQCEKQPKAYKKQSSYQHNYLSMDQECDNYLANDLNFFKKQCSYSNS